MKIMKKIWKKEKKKKRIGSHGIITVFLTLMMVPVVAISSVMVDVARLNFYSSQAVMAADTYGDAVLSEFDNLLKELYGLFSVTQNKEGLEAVNKLADTVGYSFNPVGDGKSLSGFMPYKDADVKISYEKVDGASLSNNNVLMTQISDFMKYRIVEQVMDENGILSSLGKLDNVDDDMEAVKQRKEISETSQKILQKVQEYYDILKKVAAYPSYMTKFTMNFQNYSRKLRSVAASQEYKDYVYYKINKTEIEEILLEFGDSENNTDNNSENTDADSGDSEDFVDRYELYERYKDFDVDKYVDDLREEIWKFQEPAQYPSSDPIDFESTPDIIKELGEKTTEVENALKTLNEQVNRLKDQLKNCSPDLKSGIEDEIQDLENILKLSKEFREVYDLIETQNKDTEQNSNNEKDYRGEIDTLDNIRIQILDGNIEPDAGYWHDAVMPHWYDFREDKDQFYRELVELCENESNGEGDKDAGNKKIEEAENAQEEAEKELDKDEVTQARNIPDEIASQLQSGGSTEEVPKFGSYFLGGLSLKKLSAGGEHALDKFLVTSYDFGMFSSRVTGMATPTENSSESDNKKENDSKKDISLTGFKMSPDINYLYGAELEYLLGGYNDSTLNLNKTKNIICGVRKSMNFISSYTIKEVNEAISLAADGAAAAVAATGIGAAIAPLTRLAVSGALRYAFARIETVGDWKELIERDNVVFLKTELGDLQAADSIASLLHIDITGNSKYKLGLSYEDYVFILLCIFTDTNTLMSRTSNLVTLNMNQAKHKGGEWSSLDFKMQDTVTAVKATCKVKADFVVLPDNFAEMFYSGTSTESQIERLENHYFGYSVIRGY